MGLNFAWKYEPVRRFGQAEIGSVKYGWPMTVYSYEADRYVDSLFANSSQQRAAMGGLLEENRTGEQPVCLDWQYREGDAFVSGETAPAL